MTNEPSWNSQFYNRIEHSLTAIEVHVARVREFISHLKVYNKHHSNFKNVSATTKATNNDFIETFEPDFNTIFETSEFHNSTESDDAQALIDAINKLHPHNIIEKGGNKQDGKRNTPRSSNQQDRDIA